MFIIKKISLCKTAKKARCRRAFLFSILFYSLNKDIIQSRAVAPINEVIRLPMMPPLVLIPSRENTQPPKRPPMMPMTRFMMKPKPPPRIILPAKKPDNAPITINHINPML